MWTSRGNFMKKLSASQDSAPQNQYPWRMVRDRRKRHPSDRWQTARESIPPARISPSRLKISKPPRPSTSWAWLISTVDNVGEAAAGSQEDGRAAGLGPGPRRQRYRVASELTAVTARHRRFPTCRSSEVRESDVKGDGAASELEVPIVAVRAHPVTPVDVSYAGVHARRVGRSPQYRVRGNCADCLGRCGQVLASSN